jgi:hypothetical protein
MCAKHVQDAPQWFRSRDYTYTHGLTKEGWFIAFADRLVFDAIPESPEFFVSDDADPWHAHRNSYGSPDDLFRAYLARTQGPPGRFTSNHHFPAIRHISDLDDAKAILESDHVALIAIELDASAGTSIAQFTDWLSKRKQDSSVAPSFPRRGRTKPADKVLTRDVLNSWDEQRILQLWDLRFWRKLHNTGHSNNTLGCWLFPHMTSASDPTDKYNYSLEKLKDAVKLFFALRFELGGPRKE